MKKSYHSLLVFSCLSVISCFLLISCIDLKVDLNFTELTSGIISLDALVDNSGTGMDLELTGDKILNFPTTQAAMDSIIQSARGARLLSYSISQELTGKRIKASISFSNPEALEGIFRQFGQDLSLKVDQSGLRNLKLTWQTPQLNQTKEKVKQLWNLYYNDKTWVVNLTVPVAVRSQSDGARQDSRHISWEINESVLTRDQAPSWNVVW